MFKLSKTQYREGFDWYDVVLVANSWPKSHGTRLTEWPNAVYAEGFTFVWEEVNRLFTFGAYVGRDPMHNNQPYLWSSRAGVIGHYCVREPLIDVNLEIVDGFVVAGYAVRVADLAPLLPPELVIEGPDKEKAGSYHVRARSAQTT